MFGVLTFAVMLAIAWSVALRAADPSGRWSATFMTQVGEQVYTYEFIVKGTTLTDTAKGSLTGEGKITDGKDRAATRSRSPRTRTYRGCRSPSTTPAR
jgi:hypothetical protein